MVTAECIGELATYNSHEEYDADDRVRSTQLKTILDAQGPRAYYLKYIAPPADVDKEYDANADIQPKVDEKVLGILLHEFGLEGKQNFFRCTTRRGSKAWVEEIEDNDGKWALNDTNFAKLHAWREALLRNTTARKLIESGSFSEQAFRFTHGTGIKAKARVDMFSFTGSIYDLKTTVATNRAEFDLQSMKLHYPFQAAYYEMARNSVPQFHGMRAPFHHIIVCKKHPYWCYVWPLHDSYLRVGHKQLESAFERLAQCRRRHAEIEAEGGEPITAWPDYEENKQSDEIAAPDWYLSQHGWNEDTY